MCVCALKTARDFSRGRRALLARGGFRCPRPGAEQGQPGRCGGGCALGPGRDSAAAGPNRAGPDPTGRGCVGCVCGGGRLRTAASPVRGGGPRFAGGRCISRAVHGSVLLALSPSDRRRLRGAPYGIRALPRRDSTPHILLLGLSYISSQAWLYYVCLHCSPSSKIRRRKRSQDKEKRGRLARAKENKNPGQQRQQRQQ